MERRLTQGEAMTIEVLHERGVSNRAIARTLGVTENTVRHRLARQRSGAKDRRGEKVSVAEAFEPLIRGWIEHEADSRGLNLAALHERLVTEHGYAGSYKSLQRYVRSRYPKPRLRTRRRIETPPGAQAQADWAEFPKVRIGDALVDLHAFELVLSHSRMDAVVWSEREDQLAWLSVHNEALRRLDGVPAVIRVDKVKTAVAQGAGPWGTLNETYRTYAKGARFHIDASRPRCPGDKGKVERRIRDHRLGMDPCGRAWESVAELQAWTDTRVRQRAEKRLCPATGDSVWASYEAERPLLTPLPLLPEPFDLVAQRRVAIDATVRFEGRGYSVPFAWTGREVEVRGCARIVQILAEGGVVAEHARHTRCRLVLDPRHYDGPSTERVQAPVPLGRMGRRLEEIAALEPERRPIDLYAALAEVPR